MIRQLHYTSLQDGPSGHSGFQFCARSNDTSDEILRWVERLTAYEKPWDIDPAADPSQFPVNLIFARLDPPGLAMIAQVVYTGQDFSQRSGNYFAHALIIDDLRADLREPLPALMWGASLWCTEPGQSEHLPVLRGPLEPGIATLQSVSEAVSGWADSTARLAWLVTAVDIAMSGGPRVLMIGSGGSSVWQWIAATSYLLGPVVAPAMSFCTYSHDLERSGTHVVGVAGSTRVPASHQETFTVFDLRDSELPNGEGSPFAMLVAGAGLATAQRAWQVAVSLGRPNTDGIDAWYPILACALMSLRHELAGIDLDAAVEWLASGNVSRQSQDAVVASVAAQRLGVLSSQRQAQLVDFALAIGAGAEHDTQAGSIEETIVRDCIDMIDRSGSLAGVMRLRTRQGLAAGSAACSRMLSDLDPARALKLLLWAGQAGVVLEDDIVKEAGREAAAAALLERVSPVDLKGAAELWPELRAGVIERVSKLPDAALSRIFRMLEDGTFRNSDFNGALQVGERWLSVRAGVRGASLAEEFVNICDLRRETGMTPAADVALLRRLWPQNAWTPREAHAVIDSFPAHELQLPPVRDMLIEVFLNASIEDETDRRSWVSVACAVAAWPVELQRALNVDSAISISECSARVRQATAAAPYNSGQPISYLVRYYDIAAPLARRYLEAELPPLLIYYHSRPCQILARGLPPQLMSGFCQLGLRNLQAEPHDAALAAYFFNCMVWLKERKVKAGDQIGHMVLAPMAEVWDRGEIADISRALDKQKRGEGRSFKDWIKRNKRPPESFLKRFR
jgi:GTPase-associated protein 1, N-terminal domain type 2/GTPase-associated protein 1, C-terminal domain/GTPase-associated protein 1, middle domain